MGKEIILIPSALHVFTTNRQTMDSVFVHNTDTCQHAAALFRGTIGYGFQESNHDYEVYLELGDTSPSNHVRNCSWERESSYQIG